MNSSLSVSRTCNAGVSRSLVSRTGYTGDLGYEVWVDPEDALPLWDAIFAVQGQYDIHAIGSGHTGNGAHRSRLHHAGIRFQLCGVDHSQWL